VELAGHWRLQDEFPAVADVEQLLEGSPRVQRLTFETTGLTGWDSGLVTFLMDEQIAPEVRALVIDTLEAATALLRDSQQLVRRVDAQVVPMSTGIQKTLDAFRATLQDSQQLVRHVDARVTPMTDNLMETSTRLRATIARMQQVVDGDVVKVLQDTNKTLQEFSGTARSFRLLADYLERNPDSLVYGKAGGRR
jgi:ABC-type transporter Mla subunit MlaD